MKKKRAHGGARKGAGRPPAEDKADRPVYFRLTGEQMQAAKRAAREAGTTVNSMAKELCLRAIGMQPERWGLK